VGYYRKFGFEKEREIFLEQCSPPLKLSIMVREPSTSAKTTISVTTTKRSMGPHTP
jgi:hypothetical protein